jgi:hypothetical protein
MFHLSALYEAKSIFKSRAKKNPEMNEINPNSLRTIGAVRGARVSWIHVSDVR